MEQLKSMIPEKIKQMIAKSTPDDLPSACSSLHDFFFHLPLFHQTIGDLMSPELALCSKDRKAALELKQKGNNSFSASSYSGAVDFYSQALRVAPMGAVEKENKLVSILYVNRASSLHKMGLFVESLRDCNRALKVSPRYSKAWYRRGKANTSLQNYDDAASDLKIAIEMEKSYGGKRQMENDLKLISDQHEKTGNSFDKDIEKSQPIIDELPQVKLQCVSTATKGRGMSSMCDIPPSSLVHSEEPYAAIILKDRRDTYCHFCFNELPLDTVPCPSCSIPLYCSQRCQIQARGQQSKKCHMSNENSCTLSGGLERYFTEVTTEDDFHSSSEGFAEHGHECHGTNWPLMLPPEVVLAGRILVKLMERKRHSGNGSRVIENLELSDNYVKLPLDTKLVSHVYSVVLLYCLQCSYESMLQLNGATISKVVILLSQIGVNSMAVVRIKSGDTFPHPQHMKNLGLTKDVVMTKQFAVARAIYLTGSLFNHSCVPNIQAYFLSRTLAIRAKKFVVKGSELELSYGPEVGQAGCPQRQRVLEDTYSFRCQCTGCSEVNLSDLVFNAFRCIRPNCLGVVLDERTVEFEKYKVNHLKDSPEELEGEDVRLKIRQIKRVAPLIFQRTSDLQEIQAGRCLSCGASCDLECLRAQAHEAETLVKSLQKAVESEIIDIDAFSSALRSLEVLKSTLHSYNKKIAEAEDILAETFCLAGQMRPAMDLCTESMQILKKLYCSNHIVIGNELVKHASIQLSLGDSSTIDTVNELGAIFSTYYGRHAVMVFPHLQDLNREACKLANEDPS